MRSMKMLFLSLFLTGCSAEVRHRPLAFEPAPDLSEQQRALLEDAAAQWNEIALQKIELSPSASQRIVLRFLKEEDGFKTPDGDIQIRRGLSDERFLTVAIHEMGHALGLGHVESGLMDKEGSQAELTEQDLVECRRVSACP